MANEKKIKLTDLTTEELAAKLKEAREKLFKLKFAHKTTPLKNPLDIRFTRKEVARILTILKLKQKGVSAPKAAARS